MSENKDKQQEHIDGESAPVEEVVEDMKKAESHSSDEVFSVPSGLVNTVLVAVLSLVAGIAIGAVAFGGGDGLNETQLRTILREQLSEVGSFSASPSTGGGTNVNYLGDDDAFIGPADAPVTIVEFSDFLCSFCGRHFEQTLTPILERYDGYVRYVYRDNPGVGGQAAVMSAMGAECAADQSAEQFWEYHEILFSNQGALGSSDLRGVLIGFANDVGLDLDEFTACFDEQRHIDDIRLDALDAQSIGANGTPAFYINGYFLSGARDFQTFTDVIDRALRAEGIDPADI